MSLVSLILEDLKTHEGNALAPGFLALAVHRFGNWRMGFQSAEVRLPFTLAYRASYWATKALWGIDLPYTCQIGRRFRIEHHGLVNLGAWAIGDDVIVRHGVTVGLVRKNTLRAPIIGDRVELGPGACVVGNITVGNDCVIGPNTVLTTSLPHGTACLGNPCRIVDKSVIHGP
jgi:serine O-acetyltransferase